MRDRSSLYILRKHVREFPMEGFVYKKRMTVEGVKWSKNVHVYGGEEEALKDTARDRNTYFHCTNEARGVIEITEFVLWERRIDEDGAVSYRIID